ncbi:uncharacterized protein RJT21DRAFT_122857 [Scheffersomyces amazonensis]|uniref:uncharacterized protein n=1 Tax=Scheffersomyces amazonensis TaxID=1078765 RepID=UPI00315D7A5F
MTDPNDSVTFGNSLSLRVDGAIGAMSLSPNGRDAVLAGRRGLFIIDLDDPFTTPRWLHHITSWEVADVQWSPHHFSKPSWCISTSNQKALLWDLSRPSNNAIISVLHNHSRAITDINFHPSDPEILATCSIDTFILSWDMRAPRKPVAQWAEWRAGATQVKWNHENPYEIASSHDNSFYIWDSRNGALPVVKVHKAHAGKINGLDFSNGSSNIITCSNDNTVKFWDLSTNDAVQFSHNYNYFNSKDTDDSGLNPAVVIETDFPIARARALPFGKDKACGIMPLRGGQDAIHIVNYDTEYSEARTSNESQIIKLDSNYLFKGHNGPMKDFLWRTKHDNYEGFESKNKWKEFQLVTWSSADYDLKLWPHDEELYKQVNYNPSYHRFLDAFKGGDGDEDSDTNSNSNSTRPQSPSTTEGYDYQTYIVEPEVSIEDLKRRNNGDLLSSLTSYQIYEKYQKQLTSTNQDLFNQLNHLDWISGVRMGRASHGKDDNNEVVDGPSNLGEEVSIVGHKFPKVRFERISVSTGDLVLSLRGPIPVIEMPEDERSEDGDETTTSTMLNNNTTTATTATSNSNSNSNTTTAANSTPNTTTNNTTSNITGTTTTINTSATATATATATTTTSDESVEVLVFIRLRIKFPKDYPFLEEITTTTSNAKKLAKLHKLNSVKFEIEETHELTASIRDEMLMNLMEIATFYTNKHKRFCLEPCLRYLMGDKIDLTDDVMRQSDSNEELGEGGEFIQEVGTEGWADDLINQQPGYHNEYESSAEEDNDGYNDLIVNNDELLRSIDSVNKINPSGEGDGGEVDQKSPVFDSTPIPKGCGAVWSPTGQLVCFFIPKETVEDEDVAQRKFNIFKFTDGGFSLNTHHHHHHHQIVSSDSESEHDDYVSDPESHQSHSEPADYDDDIRSVTSSSSDDSFTNDWNELLDSDAPARTRVPGMFVGLGNRYMNQDNPKSGSFNRFASHGGGTISNYKSSLRDDTKRRRDKKIKNVVGIFDFRHLLPDKYELACEYRVLGDSPENLARYNSQVALKYGLGEISDVWKILEVILIKTIQPLELSLSPNANLKGLNEFISSGSKYGPFYWGSHPFGASWLIREIFKYFEYKGNIQMLTMMSCILYENPANFLAHQESWLNVPIHTPYKAMPPPPSIVAVRNFNEGSLLSGSNNLNSPDDITFPPSMSHRNSYSNNSVISPDPDYAKKNIPSSSYTDTSSYFDRVKRPSGPKPRTLSHLESKRTPRPLSKRTSKVLNNTKNRKYGNGAQTGAAPPLAPQVNIDFYNVPELDLFEDMFTVPLLSCQDEQKINSYRQQYADMLYIWGLPINRIKILKFNHPPTTLAVSKRVNEQSVHGCKFGLRYKVRQHHDQEFHQAITPIGSARSNAWNTSRRNVIKYCNYCNLIVSNNLVVCTNCEHIVHTECASQWWADGQEDECPSGCGCKCLEYVSIV